MDLMLLDIYFWRNRAYIPVTGFDMDINATVPLKPVFISELVVTDLVSGMQKALDQGTPELSGEKLEARKASLLTATGAKNDKELGRGLLSCHIRPDYNGITVNIWRNLTPIARHTFPRNVLLEELAVYLIQQIRART